MKWCLKMGCWSGQAHIYFHSNKTALFKVIGCAHGTKLMKIMLKYVSFSESSYEELQWTTSTLPKLLHDYNRHDISLVTVVIWCLISSS